jgi:hypothetical protein
VSALGPDKAGDILVVETLEQGMGPTSTPNSSVYNIHSNTSTAFSTLPVLVNNGFSYPQPILMDDDGRILLTASRQTESGGVSQHVLLLTPADQSSAPSALRSHHRWS